jgi:hypothetical protein
MAQQIAIELCLEINLAISPSYKLASRQVRNDALPGTSSAPSREY